MLCQGPTPHSVVNAISGSILVILRAGMKLASVIPGNAQGMVQKKLSEKGIDIDLNQFKPDALDEIVKALADLSVEIDGDGEQKVRVFCE